MASQQPEPIAIVGSGCRFPGDANSPSSLWKLLENPRHLSKDITGDRFDLRGYYHPDGAHHGTSNVSQSYFLEEDIWSFDANFFNISPNEADSMDPQQRLLMETVYEALESGGHTIESLHGSDTAVFVGNMSIDYHDLLMRDVNTLPTYYSTGVGRSILSNRISYFFDWHGPSMTIDTACSSSLIAVHQAVQALRSGESRVAVACGTQVILGPEMYIAESKMNLLSPTSRSRMWDADADGYARGEGMATVILKKLSDAIADGDHIESLIRETGSNQDGRSKGLTVPSSEAQAALIRQTYTKAGLDLKDPRDQPQFFEAHGTGTKVGDPREAAAIQQCFNRRDSSYPLYVGSIKTVIGHTEGTAGLAGLLKASLAIQHGVIPPNLLFNRLNPSIEPYYQGLHVPTSLTEWPKLLEGVPRRASINSFGFGGSNAHAILEHYQSPAPTKSEYLDPESSAPFTPFTFSAVSELSLVTLLEAYSAFLKENNEINLSDLAWTLQSRRSQFQLKAAFGAPTTQRLVVRIDEKLAAAKQNPGAGIGIRSNPGVPCILGVFTGQGAQWASMGGNLIRSSAFVRERIRDLRISLDTLPLDDRPQWKLEEEILAEADTSRLSQAELAQPLCTAIQIVLVDLLRTAGITFKAVVGHSSGEIAAAYAAGFFSASDAIRIAYYRGLHAKLAGDPSGQKGAMLAVGTSWEDAQDLIDLPFFRGRLNIAAHNSSASVTLSGNADAILHAKKVFDEEKKFARLLLVDKAYHSHHMLSCGDQYIRSLQECGISVNQGRDTSCTWYSSVVLGKEMEPTEDLQDVYWRDNMTNPVLFAEAIKSAADVELNLVLEIGPHPALAGPAAQNISEVRSALPYSGILKRGSNDIEAFSDALGFVWSNMGTASVDFQGCEKSATINRPPKLLVGLPSYQWNKARTHKYESRKSRKIRASAEVPNELLGILSPDSTERDQRWMNLLKASEISWLEGHQLQGQIVFPAAGYVAMALAASKSLAGNRDVELFELHDLVIQKAIAFEDDVNFAVETLITLTAITPVGRTNQTRNQTADFSLYSCANSGSSDEMELVAKGTVNIVFGAPSDTTLSSVPLDVSNMSPADIDKFYTFLDELGYGYSGPFRALSSPKRRFNQCSAFISTYPYTDSESTHLVHPSMLDIAFQAEILALSAPGDDRLWSIHVPTSIRCIRVNPKLCASIPPLGTTLPICAVFHDSKSLSLGGSVDIFSANGLYTMIQVEDISMKPFAPATVADDRRLFSYTKWDFAAPNGIAVAHDERPSTDDIEVASLCERLSYYYLRKWKSGITDDEWKTQAYLKALQNFMNYMLSSISSGRQPNINKEWSNDTWDNLDVLIKKYSDRVDLKLILAVGECFPAVVRGETTILEHMLVDNMLDDFYKNSLGFAVYNSFMGKMVNQITHRYPHAKILEIGAGTGGATKSILETIGNTFSSYTYTDISAGFFEDAAKMLKLYNDKISFKVLDIEKSPASQGFNNSSYDIIIASNVLHATTSLQKTLENTRQLLRPGGYLILLEITSNKPIRFNNIVGGLPGWWDGVDDGRQYAPTITPGQWHTALRKAGFSGVDSITPEIDGTTWPYSVMATQAVDDQVNFLRNPLSHSSSSIYLDEVVILGNGSLQTARITEELSEYLGRVCGTTTVLEGLPTTADALSPMSTIINLVDLDSPIFKDMTADKMDGLKRLFEFSKRVLWITKGARDDDPYQMASLSFVRSVRLEMPHIHMSNLDVSDLEHSTSKVIAEYLISQCAMDEWEAQGLGSNQLLWSKELEFYLEGGRLMIPRIVENQDLNARLNCSRRTVTKTVAASSNLSISRSIDSMPSFIEEPLPENSECLIQVETTSFMAFGVTSDSFLYLSVGKNSPTMNTVVALSQTNSSKISPVASVAVDTDVSSSLLTAIASELLVASLTRIIPSKSCLMVYDPCHNKLFAAVLNRRMAEIGILLSLITTRMDEQDPQWIKFNIRAPRHALRKLFPAKITHFLDLTSNMDQSDVGVKIVEALPLKCKQIDPSDIFRELSSQSTSDQEVAVILDQLENAISAAKMNNLEAFHDFVIPLSHIHDKYVPGNYLSVVDWTSDEGIVVQVRPIDARRLFSQNKTYILVGLTGELGKSICEWMVRNGAGCVCLTSRHPNVSAKWLKSLEGTGAIVKVLAMDVTDKQSLKKVVDDIRATCPPIAGVANGAMVLHDGLFMDMSVDQMQEVLAAKVDGTNNLDELFYDEPLDFFIVFSSLCRIVGNPGQSNYAAANGYMSSLVRQRRNRGLAASAIDIGRVVGVGYVDSASQVVVEQLKKYGYMAISEFEFHQMFAETVYAGNPALGLNPLVITGLRYIRDNEEVKGPWFEDPQFSHCIIETNVVSIKQDDKKITLPVMEQISNAGGLEEALVVLKDCFSVKLQHILQISDESISHDSPIIELGIDSLVAVEVRSWFLKELKVDMPVLKLLGGGSMADICQQVLEKLPEKVLSCTGEKPAKLVAQQKPPKPHSSSSTPASLYTPPSTSFHNYWSVADSSTQLSSVSSEISITDSTKPDSSPPALFKRPISPLSFVKSYPISFAQSRFWFLRILLEDQTTFNVALYYHISGSLRIDYLERAIRVVGSRHEGLRTCFVEDKEKADLAYQKITTSSSLRLEHKKISHIEDVIIEYAALKAHVFDISHGELMRVIVLSLSPTSHYLLLNYHHIAMDGSSYQVFFSDLEKAYKGQSLGPPPRQFSHFSNSQRKAFENGEMNSELKYWRSVFQNEPPILPLLPMARVSSRVSVDAFDIHQVEFRLDPELAARVKSVSKANLSTPFAFYLAAFKVMLFRFTDVQDLTIGIADANRNDDDVLGTIGFFLNLLTLRFNRQGEQRFREAIVEARETTFAALRNSRLPFDVLLNELNVPRSSAYSPFFQAFFDYRPGSQDKHTWGNCQFEVQEVHPGRTAYDITLDVIDSTAGAIVTIRAQKTLYDLEAARLLLKTYIDLLDVLSTNASLSLRNTPIFSEKQLTHAVGLGRGPNLKSNWPGTLPHRIDQIVEQNQEKTALMDGIGRVLTYADMNNRIGAISEELLKAGVTIGSRVLVFQKATSDWPCSMLAIMRVGGIYVPLDLRNPLSRLAAVAVDCQPSAVLADGTTFDDAKQLSVPDATIINVSLVDGRPSSPVPNGALADSPAAILYTSGSTGLPKGIIVKHSGLCNEIEGYTKIWKLGAERTLQQSAFTFNHSSDQIYTGLVNGGMVYIVPMSKRGDPLEITKIIQQHNITYTKATPSEYSLWMQYGRDNLRRANSWRFAFGGGETLTNSIAQEFAELDLPQLRFFNSYGPTEVSISSTKMEILYREKIPQGRIPCGYSLPNYSIYVLDDQLKPLPAGMPGELFIGGAGVSLGYLNNDELNNQQFLPDPYATPEYIKNGWTRMYRTGDIGHMKDDGAMVFHSRIADDAQVKIRGLRIELSDIESNIVSAADGTLRGAVVTLREGDLLIAHVVFAPHHNIIDKEAFLQHLLGHLPVPQYMKPVLAIPQDQFPLTNHSKVDRKAIQKLELPKSAKNSEEDMELTTTMIQLKRVWQDVLRIQDLSFSISSSTSFFLIGGNSLLVIRLQSQIREVFNVVVRLVELLGADTLSEMARKIEESLSVDLIDWEKETNLPDLGNFTSTAPMPIKTDQKTVLVTGSTGFLAKYILSQLVASPNICTIHCVAIRDKPSESPRKLPIESSKIVSHPGDLSAPLLGLSEDEFKALSSQTDVILHMGAVRSFWDSYHVLRPINVHSTKELVKLAAPRGIPIHYISTAGVLPPEAGFIASSAAAYVPAVDGTNGYVASRWASERILERAGASLGLPITVVRFGPSAREMLPNSTKKQLDEFIRFVNISQIMPNFNSWEGNFDIIPAEEVAQWLCKDMVHEQIDDTKSAAVQFSHYRSPFKINVAEMRTYIEEQRGSQGFEQMSGIQWLGRIKKLGFGYFLASQDVIVKGEGGAEFKSQR